MSIAPSPAYRRMRLLGMAEQIVVCDRSKRGCGAVVGTPCMSKGGYQNSLVGYHAPRRRALAALGLSDDEKVARMEKICADRDAARRAGQAQIDAMRVDPQIRESQARTGAAWRRVCAEVAPGFRSVSEPAREERRKPLGPIRGVTPVTDIREFRASRGGAGRRGGSPTSGGAA